MPSLFTATARWTVCLSVFLTCSLFLPASADPVNVVKLTALSLSGVALLALSGIRAVHSREVTFAPAAAVVAAGLLAAFGVATLVASTRTSAILGTYGRNSGLLAYAVAVLIFMAGTRIWTQVTAPMLTLAFVAAGLFTSAYGLLQYAGIDAIHWNNPYNPIIASLGNPDFASGYLGICVPAAAWGSLRSGWPRAARLGCGLTAGMCFGTAVLTRAVQGPLAACAGLAVLGAAWLLNRGGPTGKRGLLGLAAMVAAALSLLLAGVLHIGPAAGIFTRFSFRARTWYWQGALRMFSGHPVAGVGLDHYGAFWRQVRPDAATRRTNGASFSDAAHSVPLQMLAQGGLLLALAYLAFTLIVAASLIRGLQRLAGQERLVIAGLGGCWLAYVVQSLVSIDQVPLLTAQFAAAGAVVALGQPRTRQILLPGYRAPLPVSRRRGRAASPAKRPLPRGAAAGVGLVCIGAVVLGWFTLTPLRADTAVRTGDVAQASGYGNAALAAYQRANRILPGLGLYWQKTGALFEAAGRPASALQAYQTGAAQDPLDVDLFRDIARLAQNRSVASAAALRAVALDPTNPATVTQAAQVLRADGQVGPALRIIDRALRVLTGNADLWTAKGATLLLSTDRVGARVAFETALRLDPAQATARAGLAAAGPTLP